MTKEPKKMYAATDEPAPVKARPKIGRVPGPYYPATLRMPRPTHEKLMEYLTKHKLSLQGVLEEAVDVWLRERQICTFFPKDWNELKRRYKGGGGDDSKS